MTIHGIYNIGLCDLQRSLSLILSSVILCDYLHTCILEYKPFLTHHTQKSEIKPPIWLLPTKTNQYVTLPAVIM